MNLNAYERIHLGLFVLLRLLCFLFSGRLYLYASRSTHGLSENAEDNFLVFFTGGYWQQLLYFLLLPRKKRQSLPLARKKNNKQTKHKLEDTLQQNAGYRADRPGNTSVCTKNNGTLSILHWQSYLYSIVEVKLQIGSLTWHYPPPSCPSGKPSWPGLPRTLPSLEPGWWIAGKVGPTRSLAPQHPHSLQRERPPRLRCN